MAADITGIAVHGTQGNNITLVIYENIIGNPVPHSSTWERNGASLPGDGRFNTTVIGQLTITNLMVGDTGSYTNTLTNTVAGINRSISCRVQLQVFSESIVLLIGKTCLSFWVHSGPPTEPRSTKCLRNRSTSALVSWQNPSSPGTPPFTLFVVSLTPPSPDVNNTFTVTNTDPSFTGNFTVTGLKPNTSYTARVRAVSTHPAVGDLLGPLSGEVTFTTMLGGKR